jgi:hypothetical protein
MLGQASPISTGSWISVDTIWEVFVRCSDNVATRPDATQQSRTFQVSFTSAERRDCEGRPDTQPRRLDVVLLWEKLCYFGKAIVEDRLD